ncbi:MAG TPA: hypothetical protein VMG12_09790 [Polyangiaceae bacterium]|nr:hypothetical protein [Polyangiaceae bacterium]
MSPLNPNASTPTSSSVDVHESEPLSGSSGPSSSTSNGGLLLGSGHRVDVSANASLVRISNPEGRVELTVRCTADGCVLEFASADLALSAPGKVSLQCEELAVEARRHLALNTEGDWTSHVAGHSTTRVGGRAETHADELELRANRGDALVHANDRVRLVGEQILLNSEHEGLTSSDQLEAFWRSFGL